jgi:glycosyltransferase involved in cell wall biosynthesis
VRTLATVAKSLPESITFRFVGDGDLLPDLREELSEEVEAGDVEFAGWVNHDEVPTELSRFRLLVMPSSPTEGLPTTIFEALGCGTPVYATPVSGIPDVVRDGETGFLMQGTEPHNLCGDIVRILTQDDLSEVSAKSRQLVEEKYVCEAAIDRYKKILSDICT